MYYPKWHPIDFAKIIFTKKELLNPAHTQEEVLYKGIN